MTLFYLAVIALVAAIAFLGKLLTNELRRVIKANAELAARRQLVESLAAQLAADRRTLDTLVAERTKGFPWLASAWEDYTRLRDEQAAAYLEMKPHPAIKAAAKLREVAAERRLAEKSVRLLARQLEYYKGLYPELQEIEEDNLSELVTELVAQQALGELGNAVASEDAAHCFLSTNEYRDLPPADKYQLALDRYWTKQKKNWEIGRDYERYVGYVLEEQGWDVTYYGIEKYLEDRGRDLIAERPGAVWIVQCKRWARGKQIYEKHIFQLFASTWLYSTEHPDRETAALFFTSAALADMARDTAKRLGVWVKEQFAPKPYPCIKCNISRIDGQRIYHLPFDQQYDRTKVERSRGECYAATVREAEALGFRRAFRWRGAKEGPE